MKPQLLGRIRRNVMTLLELGADVTVLTVRTDRDFFVGLEHPRLRAEFFEARSLYLRWSQHTARRAHELAGRPRGRATRMARLRGLASRLLSVPRQRSGIVLLGPLHLVAGPCRLALRRLLTAAGPLSDAAVGGWRRLPLGIRRAGWSAIRRSVLLRRRQRRWQLRGGRPARRGVALALTWPLAGLHLRPALRRAAVQRTRSLLRPWHRTSRFCAFWRESAERGVQLAPDLLVSSDLPGLVGAGRVARRLGLPHLHDCHELYLESTAFRPSERRLLAPVERRYIRRADSVVAVNDSIAAEYERRYGRRPLVVRNCAARLDDELETTDLRILAGLPAAARVVLYQGGFSIGRGLDVCIAAVPGLPSDTHLVLLGFGPLREELISLAGSTGVAERVHVLDAVPPQELARCTASATVGLMPYQPVSRNNQLALPNKVFEYTAVGVPIVSSDLPELRRIALGAGCGEVYNPFDAGSLAEALCRVLDPRHHAAYRAAARRFGRVNVWENEREILVAEMRRISPQLRSVGGPAASTATRGG